MVLLRIRIIAFSVYFVYKNSKRQVYTLKFQRIQDMRIDHDITIKELSSTLNLHRDVYSRYERGVRDFPIDILIKLADFYNCSIDYLVGRSDYKNNPSQQP